MFRLATWKSHHKLMNNKLPSHFNHMKPNPPVTRNHHGIRKPKFHLPTIRHVSAEQPIQYNLIRITNDDIESVGIMDVALTQPFCASKSNIKHRIISTYSEKCAVPPRDSRRIASKNLQILFTHWHDILCTFKKKILSAYIVLACIHAYIPEVHLRILTFSSSS